jgi:hypothetical protein
MQWKVTIEAWPHFTGQGREADQAKAGQRVQTYRVGAVDIRRALLCAEHIASGMRSNPMVWQAPIMAIERVIEDQSRPEVAPSIDTTREEANDGCG